MTQKDAGQEYFDPILAPGNLRKIVENLPGKVKHQHDDYQYNSDSDSFENEINEFFSHTEVAIQLQDYRRSFEKEFPISAVDQITTLLDGLEFKDQELRLQTCKHITYFALGCFTTDQKETKLQRVDRLIRNNNILISHGAFTIFFQKLQQSCAEYHDSLINRQRNMMAIYAEIDLYITLIYLLLESQRHQSPSESSQNFRNELVTLEPNLMEFLFLLLAKLRERLPDKQFPIRKTVLLLWKSLLFMSGGLKCVKSSAMALKEAMGLDTKASIITKCTPQDLLLFQHEITKKYPGYTPPNFPFKEASPMTVNASSGLAEAMGYANAVDNVELLYQTLFPPKSIVNSAKNKQQQHLLQNYFPSSPYVSPAFPLPLSHTGSDVPQSISEAGNAYIANMHVSLANFQVIKERSKGIHKWQDRNKSTEEDIDDEKQTLMEGLYAKILPELQNVIVVLLKLLLTSVSPNTASNRSNEERDSKEKFESSGDIVTLEDLEEADIKRNREIYSKAISGILLLLLKWSKSSHVLKYEYISQLLADSGCMLLILKMIGLQEVTEMVSTRTDVPYYSFFDYNINRVVADDKKEEGLYTNCRNMYCSINHLRILQMLTKHKSHRIMLLVQYKSAAILKRLLKISHPVLEQYVLKLLKSQVPFLGRKWKSQNMKIISAIYLNCKTVLQDDWISKLNADEDVDDGKTEEQNLRILTQIYNGERYMPSFLPAHDEVSTSGGPGFNGFQDYDLDQSLDYNSIELDADFFNHYNAWLETEVLNADQEEEQEPTQLFGCDTPIPSSPYPSNHDNEQQFTPEELTFEINKLYIQELNAEFRPAMPLTITPTHNKKREETWKSPPKPKNLTPLFRYDGTQNSRTYLRPLSLEEPAEEEQRNEDWQLQTQDEIVSRLFYVQEKAAEKWLSFDDKHDSSNYHFKLFEVFDQELYSSSECNTSSDDYDENDYLQDNTAYDDDQRVARCLFNT
ncbi:hypothetical protein BD408DRAFT_483929 [Parasitella parasitica]|nr:hypothetical protein BD408DRAFT_483929 [Parasitella parasitica]